jgi:membrane protease YdiL (CAAX protease family)
LLIFIFFKLQPIIGILWVVGLGTIFSWWHLRRDKNWENRKILLQMSKPKGPLSLIIIACFSTIIIAIGISGFIDLFAPTFNLDEIEYYKREIEYQESFHGWLALTLLIGILIPLIEEFCFRGYIQNTLLNRYSPLVAVGISSLLFTAMHIGVPHWSILIMIFIFGAAFGVSLILFGSIWIPVIIHSIWNTSMSVIGKITGDPTGGFGDISDSMVLVISILSLALGLIGWYLVLRNGRYRVLFKEFYPVNVEDIKQQYTGA